LRGKLLSFGLLVAGRQVNVTVPAVVVTPGRYLQGEGQRDPLPFDFFPKLKFREL
jgi:hypothetical protein